MLHSQVSRHDCLSGNRVGRAPAVPPAAPTELRRDHTRDPLQKHAAHALCDVFAFLIIRYDQNIRQHMTYGQLLSLFYCIYFMCYKKHAVILKIFYIYRSENDTASDNKIPEDENEKKTEAFLVSCISMKLFRVFIVTAPVA